MNRYRDSKEFIKRLREQREFYQQSRKNVCVTCSCFCGSYGEKFGNKILKLCVDCLTMYEWQYDRKILYKNLISFEDYINSIVVANILAPEV